MEFFIIVGADGIQLMNRRNHWWGFPRSSFSKKIKLCSVLHTFACSMDLDTVNQQGPAFFSITDLKHACGLAVIALLNFFFLGESRPVPAFPLWHDSFLRKLVFLPLVAVAIFDFSDDDGDLDCSSMMVLILFKAFAIRSSPPCGHCSLF